MAQQKRIAKRFSLPAQTLEGRTWDEARSNIQEWMETATSILDGLATRQDLDAHNGLNGLQGGTIEERYHFTLTQHAYLATHQASADPHTQYAKADKSRPTPWVAAADLSGRSLADLGTRNHNDLQSVQGGGATERYHLTASEHTSLLAVLPYLFTGTGSPEGAVTAPVGSLFLRQDGGAGTTLYVKESGTGNTGWIAK